MATSVLSIANAALLQLGAEPITSISEDTKSARLINIRFDPLRDAVLRAHPWNFAITRKELSPLATTPAYEFEYQFQLPTSTSDGHCLRVLNSEDDDDYYPYKIEGRTILSNSNTFKLRFIQRVTDPTQYDVLFNEALSLRLAVDLALNLTGDLSLSKEMFGLYLSVLSEARFVDGTEGSVETLDAETWLEARY